MRGALSNYIHVSIIQFHFIAKKCTTKYAESIFYNTTLTDFLLKPTITT